VVMELDAAVAEVLREVDAAAIYLFGSVAAGEEHASSDVDLAFLAARPLDPEARWRLQERIAARLGRSVDLVDLRAASTVMQVQIIDRGRLLHDARPTERAHFEAITLSEYADLNERRAGILADISARGAVHG
jgi:uncharacterized protein